MDTRKRSFYSVWESLVARITNPDSRLHKVLNSITRYAARGGLQIAGLIHPFVLVVGFLFTCMTFFTWNAYWEHQTESAYLAYTHPQLKGAIAGHPKTESILSDLGWAETAEQAKRIRTEVLTGIDPAVYPTQEAAIARLIAQLSTEYQSEWQHVRELLRHRVTGSRRGTGLFPVAVDSVNRDGVWDLLAQELGIPVRVSVPSTDKAEYDHRDLARKMLVPLVAVVQPGLRNVRRLNGNIQWLTVFACMLVLVAVLRRLWLLRVLRKQHVETSDEVQHASCEVESWMDELSQEAARLCEENEETLDVAAAIEERAARFEVQTGETVYSQLGFVAGSLPSLGFLGTVLGMGSALLRADRLMSAENKQAAIQSMTEQLGYAFDTTLVALVCALVAGAVLVGLKRYEHDITRQCVKAILSKPGIDEG